MGEYLQYVGITGMSEGGLVEMLACLQGSLKGVLLCPAP